MPVDQKKIKQKQETEIIERTAVALCDLPHVAAGTISTFYLVGTGVLGFWKCVASYVVPTFVGNVVGGVALVAVGAHAEFFEAEAQST